MASGTAGRDLEQPAGREAGEELQDRQGRNGPDLGADPKLGRNTEGEDGTQGQRWRTGRQGHADKGQGDQEGSPREEGAHSRQGGQDSSSTVGDASWPQLIDCKQGDACQREILVSRIICKYRSEERRVGKECRSR